jgi:hypothetical protein
MGLRAVLQGKMETVDSVEILVPSDRISQKRDPYAKKDMIMIHFSGGVTYE